MHEIVDGSEKTPDKAIGHTRGRLNVGIYTIVDGLGTPDKQWKFFDLTETVTELLISHSFSYTLLGS